MKIRKETIDILNKQIEALEQLESQAFVSKRSSYELKAIRNLELEGIKLLSIINAPTFELTMVELTAVKTFFNQVSILMDFLKESLNDSYKLN